MRSDVCATERRGERINLPSMRREQIAECVSHLLNLIVHHKLKLFAKHVFPLEQVRAAFDALASRQTLGKVVLIPNGTN